MDTTFMKRNLEKMDKRLSSNASINHYEYKQDNVLSAGWLSALG